MRGTRLFLRPSNQEVQALRSQHPALAAALLRSDKSPSAKPQEPTPPPSQPGPALQKQQGPVRRSCSPEARRQHGGGRKRSSSCGRSRSASGGMKCRRQQSPAPESCKAAVPQLVEGTVGRAAEPASGPSVQQQQQHAQQQAQPPDVGQQRWAGGREEGELEEVLPAVVWDHSRPNSRSRSPSCQAPPASAPALVPHQQQQQRRQLQGPQLVPVLLKEQDGSSAWKLTGPTVYSTTLPHVKGQARDALLLQLLALVQQAGGTGELAFAEPSLHESRHPSHAAAATARLLPIYIQI